MDDHREKRGNSSVLIVDDEKANIIALSCILSPEYNVYAAKNGHDAIETAKEFLPDVILLDILMPEMDGYEVLSILKSTEETRTIPVIFVTGLDGAGDEEKGLAMGASDYMTKPFSPAIVKLRVQNQIKQSSHLKTIKALSLKDDLTGLFNRRGFDYHFRLEWNRAMRDKTPISVCMIDLDHFKKYNDTYGHPQGDAALRTVAGSIEQCLKRSIDFVSRWGGEEFVTLLPNTSSSGALAVAENIRSNIENTPVPRDNGEVTTITASVGVNTHTPQVESSLHDFFAKADEALYEAKNSGRNRVRKFEEPPVTNGAE